MYLQSSLASHHSASGVELRIEVAVRWHVEPSLIRSGEAWVSCSGGHWAS